MNIFERLIEIALIIIIAISVVIYILFTTKRKRIRQTYSNIDRKLKRRWNLLSDLAEVIKNYPNYEESTLEKLTVLKNQDYDKFEMKQRIEIDNNISKIVSKIVEISDDNQELKTNDKFIEISSELFDIEKEITEFKDSYNKDVKSYNKGIERIPENIIAILFGFNEEKELEN